MHNAVPWSLSWQMTLLLAFLHGEKFVLWFCPELYFGHNLQPWVFC